MKYNSQKMMIGLGLGLWLSLVMPLSADTTEILGAGATFPYPLYSKMFDSYHKKTGVRVNYQAIGSGGGIRQLSNKTVDFGASDAFMTDKKLAKMDRHVVHIPIVLGAVAIGYNVPNVPNLKFSSDVLTDIYMGKITKWNHPKIQTLNPDKQLPKIPITVVHRSDGSGTTFIFTDYLSKVSSTWKKKVGHGKAIRWPIGIGGKGNAGVAGIIKRIPGSVGYIEWVYALQSNINVGHIKNKSGHFMAPSLEAVSLAAQANIPEDTRITLTDTEVKKGYPMAGFTWVLLYKDQNFNQRTFVQAEETVKLVRWMITDGQKLTAPLGYVPLPKPAQKRAMSVLESVRFNQQTIL